MKRGPFAGAMEREGITTGDPKPSVSPHDPPNSDAEPSAERPEPAPRLRPGNDTKQLVIRLPRPVHRQLRSLAYSGETTITALIMQGIDLLLKKKGMPSMQALKNGTRVTPP